MQPVSLQTDLDAIDQRFIDAVIAVGGLSNVVLLDTFCGVDRDTGAFDEHAPRVTADVYVEWRRWPGRYGLEVSIFGPKPLREQMSEAEFVRRLAAELGRALVIGDCDANPWSYFRIEANGALNHVYVETDDADGAPSFNLACEFERDDPRYLPERRIWRASEPFPEKPIDAPDHMPASIRRWCGDVNADARLCESFWAPCPRLILRKR